MGIEFEVRVEGHSQYIGSPFQGIDIGIEFELRIEGMLIWGEARVTIKLIWALSLK